MKSLKLPHQQRHQSRRARTIARTIPSAVEVQVTVAKQLTLKRCWPALLWDLAPLEQKSQRSQWSEWLLTSSSGRLSAKELWIMLRYLLHQTAKKILASIHLLCLVFIMGTVLRSFPIKMQHIIFPTADAAISTALCWLIKWILKRSALLETMCMWSRSIGTLSYR